MKKYKLLNEVLIEWNESYKEDSDNILLKSEDIKNRLGYKLYSVNGIRFYMVNVNNKFWIGETLVTQNLWKAVTGKYYDNRFWNAEKDNPLCPAQNIIWEDCNEFIYNLNQLTEETFRIPTTPEWEEACGKKFEEYFFESKSMTTDDLIKLGEYAWFMENSDGYVHPVAQKLPNEYGIFDILGGLWEWCKTTSESWYAGKPVCKGGSYRIPGRECTISNIWTDARHWGREANGMGLRLARDYDTPAGKPTISMVG